MPLIGVTRIGDITGLDCIGIPICTTFRPSSKISSVHGGKGISRTDAWVSAMMETIERYSAERFDRIDASGTYCKVSRDYNAVKPNLMQRYSSASYTEDYFFDWVNGTDLLSGTDILVPAMFVGFPWTGLGCKESFQSTNGLASGNILEEAVAHGLAELIERDATTLAVVKTQLVPRLRELMVSTFETDENIQEDISHICTPLTDIILEDPPRLLDTLISRIQQVGATLWLKDLTSDIGISTIAAGILQELKPGRFFFGVGFGAHPNRIVAAQRGITEAILGRGIQVQGAHENSVRTYIEQIDSNAQGIWWGDGIHHKPLDELNSFENENILDDINLMLERLKRRNVSHVIAVNITDPIIQIPTVRLIVPELEFWSAFDFDPKFCLLGEKAQEFIK